MTQKSSVEDKFKNIPKGIIKHRQKKRPDWKFFGYSHVEFIVSNPKQAADHYCTRFGFVRIAYKGLETGSRDIASHAVRQNDITFVFTGPYKPQKTMYSDFLAVHGDAVHDSAYLVDDVVKIYNNAISKGAVSVRKPHKISDAHGACIVATIRMYGNCVHTLVENINYKGPFMPGYAPVPPDDDKLQQKLPIAGLQFVDHVVGNQPEGQMLAIAEKYSLYFGFHCFWSVDNNDVRGDISALRSIVMVDWDHNVTHPLNEPAYDENAKGLSQIEEYLVYHGEPGVQHIALNTFSIIDCIRALRARGTKFLTIGHEYYEDLRKRLKAQDSIEVAEDLDILEELQILVDFDENGYLLQIFSDPVQDRPTLFIECIERHKHDGFGKGNFNALFKSLENAQILRGNGERTEELSYKGSSKL